MWYPNGQSRTRALAALMGSIVWSFASNVQAETEYWYYNGELTTPADSRAVLSPYRPPVDSRAVLSPYRLPVGQVPKAFAKPKPGGWDWQKRKQAYLKMRPVSELPSASVPAPVVPTPAPASTSALVQARIVRVGGIAALAPPDTKKVSRALPFWPDLPVRKVR